MKLFSALLAASLVAAAAAPAEASNNNNGNGCRNRCGDTTTINNSGDRQIDRSVTNTATGGAGGAGGAATAYGGQNTNTVYGGTNTNTNRATGGAGGQGGAGGRGGRGGEGGSATIERGAVRNNNSVDSSNTNTNRNRNNNSVDSTNTNVVAGSGNSTNTVTGGDQRNTVRDSGNSENTNRNSNRARGGDQEQSQGQSQSQSNSQSQSSSSTSSANNNGNHQNIVIEGDEREVPIAPLPTSDSVGQIGDIVVPLPNIGFSGFTSTQSNGDLDYGVSVGIRVPLGAGQFREAARAEARRRTDRANFRLIQEAVWLRDQGILNQEAHPRHWAALYGTTAEKFVF